MSIIVKGVEDKIQNRMENHVDPNQMAHYEKSQQDLTNSQCSEFWSTCGMYKDLKI